MLDKQNKSASWEHRSLRDCAALFSKDHIGEIASRRVSTGFPELDRSLGGGLTNGLYVLGAVPGLGKSTLALQIACHLSGHGIPVLYFALEMNRTWITAKSISRADFLLHRGAGLQVADLLNAEKAHGLSRHEWERIDQAREQVERESANLYLYEQGPGLTNIGEIQRCIQSFRDSHSQQYSGLPLMVVVDYLQILAPQENTLHASDKQIVDDNVRELCKMRDQMGVIILLISALNRVSYNRPITLDSFKESGSIEYSADVILGMQYQEINKKNFSLDAAKARRPRELELTVLKMRYGQDGVHIPLHFYSDSSCFLQPDGAGASMSSRARELRQALSAYPVQYHDGFHQRARRLKG